MSRTSVARFADAHAERLTHRLESFSDVVMGFSLAQLSLSFVIPPHAADVYAHPLALLAFVATFGIVSATWYAHHWLFDYLFVPQRATIIVNFATLASIVWLVYQLQVYMHFEVANTVDSQLAATSYIGTFALTWSLLGLLYALSARACWDTLPAADKQAAIFKTGRLLTIGLPLIVAVTVAFYLHVRIEYTFFLIPILGVVWRIVARTVSGPSPA